MPDPMTTTSVACERSRVDVAAGAVTVAAAACAHVRSHARAGRDVLPRPARKTVHCRFCTTDVDDAIRVP